MSSFNDEIVSPSFPSAINAASSDYGISPMTTLSVNLESNLRIRRMLSFHSNEVSPKKCDGADNEIVVSSTSPNRVAKYLKLKPGIISSRQLFGGRLSDDTILSNKELNSSYMRSSYNMEYSFSAEDDFKPSKNLIGEGNLLEDQDPNSQDSGYSNSSSSYSEDSNSSLNFRFTEPNSLPERKLNTAEFPPGDNLVGSPICKKSSSYRKRILHSISTDSSSSDFSDDGFSESLILPSSSIGSSLMEQDENAQLPDGIFNTDKITSSDNSPPHSKRMLLQTNLRRLFAENITSSKTVIRSLVETEFSELPIYEKETTKRTTLEGDVSSQFLKRRKLNKKQGPATAPPISNRLTSFNFDSNVNNVKYQRSFSETAVIIREKLEKSHSDPNLIGDYTKPCVLPLKIYETGECSDLKNIDCHTLAKLIEGEYDEMISSYSIVDCRYPYEFSAGHIKGAINVFTPQQIKEELNEKKFLQMKDINTPGSENKRNILIFHCEFSSKRGPFLSRYLREKDRKKNFLQYPKLDYPEIYLLDGGYSKFYEHYKELCDPCSYVPMIHPEFLTELRKCRAKSKYWACTDSTTDREEKTESSKHLCI